MAEIALPGFRISHADDLLLNIVALVSRLNSEGRLLTNYDPKQFYVEYPLLRKIYDEHQGRADFEGLGKTSPTIGAQLHDLSVLGRLHDTHCAEYLLRFRPGPI